MTLGNVLMPVGVALAVLVVNVAISVLYMVVYGHVIDPGHDQAYYNAHVQKAGPYIGILGGIPLMFLAGWWVSGHAEHGVRSALIVWATSTIIDVSVSAAWGVTRWVAILTAVSILTKLVSVYLGALAAR